MDISLLSPSKGKKLTTLIYNKIMKNKKKFAMVLLHIRNILFFITIAEGHKLNMGNRKFWDDYICNSTDHRASSIGNAYYFFKIILDIIIAKLCLSDVQQFLHIVWSFTMASCAWITYDMANLTHMYLGVGACYFPGVQIMYFMYKKKCYKNVFLILHLTIYVATGIGYLTWMSYSQFWTKDRWVNRDKAIRCEWIIVTLAIVSHYWIIHYTEEKKTEDIQYETVPICENV